MEPEEQVEIMMALAKDPVLFVRSIIGVEPEEWQKKALYAVRDNDSVAIRSGHGIGKTAFLSWLILWWLSTRTPARIACTANTASQSSDILWAEDRSPFDLPSLTAFCNFLMVSI